MKSIKTYLFAVTFFAFYGVYANADERGHGLEVRIQESSLGTQDSELKTIEMSLESTNNTKHIVNNGSDKGNILNSLTRHIDSLNKWISLSFGKESRGIYLSVHF